jgi:hypothetical protein
MTFPQNPQNVTNFFNGKQQGYQLDMVVTRDLMHSDTHQLTDINGVPQSYKDGRPKFVLIIPVTVTNSSDGTHGSFFSEGNATIWVKGALKDEFARAMAAAGIRELKGGTRIVTASAGEKASKRPGFSPTKLYSVTLYPADGSAPAQGRGCPAGSAKDPGLSRVQTGGLMPPSRPGERDEGLRETLAVSASAG